MSETPDERSSTVRAIHAVQAEILRKAADAWGDGIEGFPYHWLHERANEIELGEAPDWSGE